MRQRAFAAIVSCVCVWRSVHVRGFVFFFRAGCLVCVRVYTYAWVPAGSLLFFYPVPVVTCNVFGSSRPKTRNRGCCWGEKKKKILRPAFCCLQNLSSQLSVFFPLLYHSLHSCFFKWNKTCEEPGRAPASMAGARSSRSDRHRSFRSLLSLQVVCSTPQCSHYAEDANRFMRYDLVSGL